MYEVLKLFKQRQQSFTAGSEKAERRLELPSLPDTCSDTSLLEDHESDECGRILFITNATSNSEPPTIASQ